MLTPQPSRPGLDTRWQSCLGVQLSHTEEHCDLAWILTDFDRNGGGYVNIFRMINNLEELGCASQQVIIVGNQDEEVRDEALEFSRHRLNSIKAPIFFATEPVPRPRALMATNWRSAYFVLEQPASLKKFYFVQDFEPLFHPAGSNAALAENTYRFGFKAVTAGRWLSEKLARDYHAEAVPYGFSCDHQIYRPSATGLAVDWTHDIFFYARPTTTRRMFELGVAAIGHALKASASPLRVVFAGGQIPPGSVPYPFLDLGVCSAEELAAIYRTTRCALVLAATNASLLPYEIMACGCPVVTNQGPNNEWIFPDGYGGVAPTTPTGLGNRMVEILAQPALHKELAAAGLRLVASTDWLDSARIVHEFLKRQGVGC